MSAQLIGMKLMDLWNDDYDQSPKAGAAGMGHVTGDDYKFILTYEGTIYEVTIKETR
jgi:hypothetical protein